MKYGITWNKAGGMIRLPDIESENLDDINDVNTRMRKGLDDFESGDGTDIRHDNFQAKGGSNSHGRNPPSHDPNAGDRMDLDSPGIPSSPPNSASPNHNSYGGGGTDIGSNHSQKNSGSSSVGGRGGSPGHVSNPGYGTYFDSSFGDDGMDLDHPGSLSKEETEFLKYGNDIANQPSTGPPPAEQPPAAQPPAQQPPKQFVRLSDLEIRPSYAHGRK